MELKILELHLYTEQIRTIENLCHLKKTQMHNHPNLIDKGAQNMSHIIELKNREEKQRIYQLARKYIEESLAALMKISLNKIVA